MNSLSELVKKSRMKTKQQMTDAGYERVGCHGQRRSLWTSEDGKWEIRLTNGVNGFGLQNGQFAVVLLQNKPEKRIVRIKKINTFCQLISDIKSKMHDWSFADFVSTAEVDAAKDRLISKVKR